MRGLVFVVSCIVAMAYISVWIVCVVPHADIFFNNILGLFKLAFMSSILGMLILSYYRAITTPPGVVPRGWIPEGASEDELQAAIEVTRALESTESSTVMNEEVSDKIPFLYPVIHFTLSDCTFLCDRFGKSGCDWGIFCAILKFDTVADVINTNLPGLITAVIVICMYTWDFSCC